jgi:hypothetical protein
METDVECSPIRDEWPSTSLLSREHFTVDQQHCLNCHKQLGYAMPMNRTPKICYLFCDRCPKQIQFLNCEICGNLNNENTAVLCHRPGNSGYAGPSQIYSFICHHCLKDQKEQEPGLEETQMLMKNVRALRRKKELEERGETALDLGPVECDEAESPRLKKRKRAMGKTPSSVSFDDGSAPMTEE